MSALPKQVQKQIDEANAIIAEMAKVDIDKDAPNPDGTPKEDPPAVKKEDTPKADPTPEENSDHKYKVLQGKYNAEVPRLQTQLKEATGLIRDMQQRLTNTESLLASLQHVRTEPDPKPSESPAKMDLPVVTADETAQFGADLEDYIERVAARKIMPQIESQLAPVNKLADRVESVEQSTSQQARSVASSDRDRVMLALTNAVPEWETQNENEDFLNWLNETDPYAGVPRGQLLTHAFTAHDSERVIAFFKGFQKENAVVTPEPNVTPPTDETEPQRKLDDLVAPGTPKTGTTSAPKESGKRVWTQQDISTFYAKKNIFVIKGKPIPDEYVALEKDLFAAQHEGRIR